MPDADCADGSLSLAWVPWVVVSTIPAIALLFVLWMRFRDAALEAVAVTLATAASVGRYWCRARRACAPTEAGRLLGGQTCETWHVADEFLAIAVAVVMLMWVAFPLDDSRRYAAAIGVLYFVATSLAYDAPFPTHSGRVWYLCGVLAVYVVGMLASGAWRNLERRGAAVAAVLVLVAGVANLLTLAMPTYYIAAHSVWHEMSLVIAITVFVSSAPRHQYHVVSRLATGQRRA